MNDLLHSYKKCPECLTNLPLEAEKCTECQTKIGPVDKRGLAKRPTNWSGYIIAIGLWILFGCFVWWAFFK